jgi:Integrase core domain
VLADNGKQFAGGFTKPRLAEALFERVCREHGITTKLTGPYSPTTTGKVERWHRTLRCELPGTPGPFAGLPSAQAAISAWVHAYNHLRSLQALDMATPASLLRPGVSPDREPAATALRRQAEAESRLGRGRSARVWADEVTADARRGPRPGHRPRCPPRPRRPTRRHRDRASRAVDVNGNADSPGARSRSARNWPAAKPPSSSTGTSSTSSSAASSPRPCHHPSPAATAPGCTAPGSPAPRYPRRLPAGQRPAQGPPRRRHHGQPPAAPRRQHLRRQDRQHPHRGHPLPRNLRRHGHPAAPAQRATTGHQMASQDPPTEACDSVQHVLRPSSTHHTGAIRRRRGPTARNAPCSG